MAKTKKKIKPSEAGSIPPGAAFEVQFSNPYFDVLDKHIIDCAKRGLPELQPNLHSGATAVVVGSGPSLSDDPAVLAKVRELYDDGAIILACKAAIKYLYDHGITPHYGVSMDPGDHIGTPEKMFKAPGTTHLIASSSNPATFDYLLNEDDEWGRADVVVFHSACGCKDELKLYKELFSTEWVIGGGVNVVNRAISIAQHMNVDHIWLAGADCGWRRNQDFYCDKSETKYSKIHMTDSALIDGVPWYSVPDMLFSGVLIAQTAQEFPDRFHFIGDSVPRALSKHKPSFFDKCACMS